MSEDFGFLTLNFKWFYITYCFAILIHANIIIAKLISQIEMWINAKLISITCSNSNAANTEFELFYRPKIFRLTNNSVFTPPKTQYLGD